MSDVPLGPVILDVEGFQLSTEEIQRLRHPYVGGVILFSRNFESSDQISNLVAQIRSVKDNLLIAVDQEGGRVQRFKEGFTRLPSLQRLANAYLSVESPHYQSDDLIKESAWLMASELIAVGVDLSFAPVVDADDCLSQVIGDRSFSKDIDTVSQLGRLYIEGMHQAGMASTLKHFPGHGAVVDDSHLALPEDHRSLEEVFETDMKPFEALLPLSEGVMPAHIRFSKVDEFTVGFSRVWLQQVLRDRLQYSGIIFSDDLSMAGASSVGGYAQRALAALNAGCDGILVCNNSRGADDVLTFLSVNNLVINNRLSTMRAKIDSTHLSLSALRLTDRWKKISSIIETLEF